MVPELSERNAQRSCCQSPPREPHLSSFEMFREHHGSLPHHTSPCRAAPWPGVHRLVCYSIIITPLSQQAASSLRLDKDCEIVDFFNMISGANVSSTRSFFRFHDVEAAVLLIRPFWNIIFPSLLRWWFILVEISREVVHCTGNDHIRKRSDVTVQLEGLFLTQGQPLTSKRRFLLQPFPRF